MRNSADGAVVVGWARDAAHQFLTFRWCAADTVPCPADWDGNGIVNSADVGAYLTEYFATIGKCP